MTLERGGRSPTQRLSRRAASPASFNITALSNRMCRLTAVRVVGHEVKIETVPQRVARSALQLDETGVNGSSFRAQTGQFRQDERGSRPVQIPPRALIDTASHLVKCFSLSIS
jgi:hypothetical protein